MFVFEGKMGGVGFYSVNGFFFFVYFMYMFGKMGVIYNYF